MDIVVLASGRGSNFVALLSAQRDGSLPVRIVELISDRPGAPVLAIAADAGIDTHVIDPSAFGERAAFDRALFAHLARLCPELVVLAGFMRILPAHELAAWQGRMINIHPSLLPRHPGLHTHRRALEAGDRRHGASVHYVSAEVDGGALISQVVIDVEPGDTPGLLAARLLPHEHALLVASVGLIARGRVRWGGDRPLFDGRPLRTPVQFAIDPCTGRMSCPA